MRTQNLPSVMLLSATIIAVEITHENKKHPIVSHHRGVGRDHYLTSICFYSIMRIWHRGHQLGFQLQRRKFPEELQKMTEYPIYKESKFIKHVQVLAL